MRLALTLLFVSLLVFPSASITLDRDHDCDWNDDGFLDDCDVDWCEDTNTLIIEYEEDEDQVVKITKRYELFVNGEKVKLNGKQKDLVKDYYKHMKKLRIMALEIGEEAAKIGEWGGKVAVEAIRMVCERILDDDDDEIEELGRAIEAEAEEIEKAVVPELEELEWF